MKRLIVAASMAALMLTGGCASLGVQTSPSVQLSATKALGLSWAALDGAANAVEAARTAGYYKAHPKDEAAAFQALAQARAILRDADAAWHSDQHADPASAIANVADLIARVRALSGN